MKYSSLSLLFSNYFRCSYSLTFAKQSLLIYTLPFSGGLTAVIWTDFIQVVIMVLGAFILMIMSKIISLKKYEAFK